MGKEMPFARFLRKITTAPSRETAKEAGKEKSAVVATLEEIMQLLDKLNINKK